MPSSLLTTTQTGLVIDAFLAEAAGSSPVEIAKVSADTRAWFASADGRPCFLKWVEAQRYADRLMKDVSIGSRRLHPAIVPLLNVARTADGWLLVFQRVCGDCLGESEPRQRFVRLPRTRRLRALRTIFAALAAIVEAGWVLVDFYDGNLIYDFERHDVWLFDFELFQRGDGFTLAMDRNYGSRRLMAPEEFVRGAWIDQRTNVFTLGRFASVVLDADAPAALADVLRTATQPQREARYSTVRAFVQAFEAACE